ncbi:replication protein RepA [Xanthobacter dioxanivorans]|uniref:replication protein RepA n=1 Tax=Xanthobacter dioxanivorans TaxID=2528964 RepID=UPI001E290B57|nr:replication protein RepA [Xanthobacter dioxanivorans]
MSLLIQAGELTGKDQQWVQQPLPFGPKARLIMIYLCSEAIRQKNPTIEIADSLSGFIRDMGFPVTGGKKGTLQAFKEQLNALAACDMKIGVWDGAGQTARTRRITPFDSIDVWLPPNINPDQKMFWPDTVTFNDAFYKSLDRHALPVSAHVIRTFAGSARKLDLYTWMGYRLHNIDTTLRVSWKALAEQFGGPSPGRAPSARSSPRIWLTSRRCSPRSPSRSPKTAWSWSPPIPTCSRFQLPELQENPDSSSCCIRRLGGACAPPWLPCAAPNLISQPLALPGARLRRLGGALTHLGEGRKHADLLAPPSRRRSSGIRRLGGASRAGIRHADLVAPACFLASLFSTAYAMHYADLVAHLRRLGGAHPDLPRRLGGAFHADLVAHSTQTWWRHI